MRPLPKFAALVSICAALLTAAACHGTSDQSTQGSALVIQSAISPVPPRVGPATLTLALSDSSGKPIIGAAINLEGDMSHAGMAPVFATSTETKPGQYTGILTFPMAGDWIILLHVTLANGTKVERQIEVKNVRAN